HVCMWQTEGEIFKGDATNGLVEGGVVVILRRQTRHRLIYLGGSWPARHPRGGVGPQPGWERRIIIDVLPRHIVIPVAHGELGKVLLQRHDAIDGLDAVEPDRTGALPDSRDDIVSK